MEDRTRRLARLARLLEQRKASSEERKAAFDIQAREIDAQRQMLLQTMDAGIAAHGLFVDLLARRMQRLDAEAHRVEQQAAALAMRMREDTRRVRHLERLHADAVREEARERDERALADLIDAGWAMPASFRKG